MAWRHSNKGSFANIRRRPGAKHCSSLCSQSEGGEYCGGQARAKNPTKICPRALAIFATCSWPSLCKQSELQCWRRNRRLCGPAQISAARALLPLYKPLFSWIFNTLPFQGRWRLFTNLDFYRILNTLIRGPHFASKVSYNAGAATDNYAGQCKPTHFPNLYFPLPQKTKNPTTHMWGHGVAGLFMIVCQYARSVALETGSAAGCQSAMSENSAPEAKSCPFCSLTARKRM